MPLVVVVVVVVVVGFETQRDFNVSRLAGAENAQTVHAGLATLTMLQ